MKSEKTYLKYDKFFQNEIISDIFHNVDNLEEIQVLFNFFKLDAKNYIEHRKNSNYSKFLDKLYHRYNYKSNTQIFLDVTMSYYEICLEINYQIYKFQNNLKEFKSLKFSTHQETETFDRILKSEYLTSYDNWIESTIEFEMDVVNFRVVLTTCLEMFDTMVFYSNEKDPVKFFIIEFDL